MSEKMREIRIEKVTLNIGVGEPGERLEKAREVLKRISGRTPVLTTAKKKIPTWKIRPGLPIGVKVTIRGDDAYTLLQNLFKAVDNKVKASSFTGNTFSFGISEYIYIPGMKYDPELGILGLDVCVTLERPGYRVKRRSLRKAKIGKKHQIKKEEAIQFIKEKFGVEVVE